jgi:hypothetical protein
MARGFESKMVEFQQEEAARAKTGTQKLTPEERDRIARRQSLELARVRAAADLDRASAPAHKQMLRQAIDALDEQLRALNQTP